LRKDSLPGLSCLLESPGIFSEFSRTGKVLENEVWSRKVLDFFLNFQGPGKSWKMKFGPGKSWNLLVVQIKEHV